MRASPALLGGCSCSGVLAPEVAPEVTAAGVSEAANELGRRRCTLLRGIHLAFSTDTALGERIAATVHITNVPSESRNNRGCN
jgi:hypothetical protein